MVKAAQIAKGPPDEKPSKAKVIKTKAAKPAKPACRIVAPSEPPDAWEKIKPHLPACIRDDPRTSRRVGFLAGFYGEKALSSLLKRILT